MKTPQEAARFSKKQLELLKEVAFMAILWGNSLIDARVANGKADRKTAKRAHDLIKKKLEKL